MGRLNSHTVLTQAREALYQAEMRGWLPEYRARTPAQPGLLIARDAAGHAHPVMMVLGWQGYGIYVAKRWVEGHRSFRPACRRWGAWLRLVSGPGIPQTRGSARPERPSLASVRRGGRARETEDMSELTASYEWKRRDETTLCLYTKMDVPSISYTTGIVCTIRSVRPGHYQVLAYHEDEAELAETIAGLGTGDERSEGVMVTYATEVEARVFGLGYASLVDTVLCGKKDESPSCQAVVAAFCHGLQEGCYSIGPGGPRLEPISFPPDGRNYDERMRGERFPMETPGPLVSLDEHQPHPADEREAREQTLEDIAEAEVEEEDPVLTTYGEVFEPATLDALEALSREFQKRRVGGLADLDDPELEDSSEIHEIMLTRAQWMALVTAARR